ncbi:hypothetical protein [Flavobacterium sp. 140616W15]|uniref:hypothetical protein n=1 Tax=Flavobacterium sp. 140616W15 TaxID=2478552 RepID=UPI000F0CEB3E|nr:hypothetical protein [Flavobacterium sp. 140616W15]AYN06129.1 hypothetical protein EAG11_19675 [Flavobacterium sp. 140616W15]
MKKKLEADLISIAHRILKLKNKSDINQLYLETQKLYEKLAVLKFIDENFEETKPTIGRGQIDATIETAFEKEEVIQSEKTIAVEEPITKEEIIVNQVVETPIEKVSEPVVNEVIEGKTEEIIEEKIIEEEVIAEIPESTEEIPEPFLKEVIESKTEEIIEEVVVETPEPIAVEESVEEEKIEEVASPITNFTPSFDFTPEVKEETPEKSDVVHISFEDIMGIDYSNAQFVKVDSFEAASPASTPPAPTEFKEKKKEAATTSVLEESKPVSLNEKLSKGFHIDLNDRIAFTKHLFGNSPEDYNRVLNQLITFDSFGEANEFLENMVKPDYNNWEGKDEYAERFVAIIEKKFS